jgi:hypothetical protein
MTDKESYELLIKYCGGEKGVLQIREMIRMVGAEGAVQSMKSVYKDFPKDFENWMRQAFKYLETKMNQPLN